jgi:hypothetical protein
VKKKPGFGRVFFGEQSVAWDEGRIPNTGVQFTSSAKRWSYGLLLRPALRAIRCANVRFGILPSQSLRSTQPTRQRDAIFIAMILVA